MVRRGVILPLPPAFRTRDPMRLPFAFQPAGSREAGEDRVHRSGAHAGLAYDGKAVNRYAAALRRDRLKNQQGGFSNAKVIID